MIWSVCALSLLTIGSIVGARSAAAHKAAAAQGSGHRRAAARAVLAQPAACANVASGRDLAVDDRGVLCARQRLSPSGCCGDANLGQYVCDDCRQERRDGGSGGTCCLTFEACVSCCRAHASLDDCARRCRTSSKSLGSAWNRYRSNLRYCDEESGKPREERPAAALKANAAGEGEG